MDAEQRVDAWLTGQAPAPAGLKYLVDRYSALAAIAGEQDVDQQMNAIYDCLVQFLQPARVEPPVRRKIVRQLVWHPFRVPLKPPTKQVKG